MNNDSFTEIGSILISVNSNLHDVEKKRILFIGYYLPPLGGAHSSRLRNFINYLDKFGWKVDVLTILPSPHFPRYDKAPDSLFRESVRVFRTSHGLLNKIYYNVVQPVDEKKRHEFTSGSKVTAGGFFSRFLKILGPIATAVMVPDSTIEWYPFGVYQGLKLTEKYKYDLLISSALPATCHFIAYTIKKRRGIPWIADYGDPWVFNPAFNPKRIKFSIEYKIEQNILRAADAIIVTAEETKKNYFKNYPALSEEKVTVIPMGADYDLFKKMSVEKSEKFRILYAGTIYGTQNLGPFLDAVKLLYEQGMLDEEIEILFIGNIMDENMKLIESKQLRDKLQLLGHLPHDKIPPLLMEADTLLLFGAQGGLQVPSKLFEYIAARRPILCIKGSEKDPSLRILQGLNRGVIVDNEKENIFSGVIRLYNLYRKRELEKKFDLRERSDYSWENRVRELDKLCKRLV